MFIPLVAVSTFLEEIFESLAKVSGRKKHENVYTLGFLNTIGPIAFFVVLACTGVSLHFSVHSLPTLIPRIILDIIQAHLAMKAILKSDRSANGFFRQLPIPLLLIADLVLGAYLNVAQIIGIVLITIILFSLAGDGSIKKKGSGTLAYVAVSLVFTTELYKYDIAHYNSIVVEQLIVMTCIVLYFWIQCVRKNKRHPWYLLKQPLPVARTTMKGAVILLNSYALSMAPASVVVTVMSSLGLIWSIIFGRKYFHEKHIGHKVAAGGGTILAILLMRTHF